MVSRKVVLHEEYGLHARPAMKIVQTCQNFSSKITICKGCKKADGCSIMELLLLSADNGNELEVIAEGGDETKAASEIAHLFENGSGI